MKNNRFKFKDQNYYYHSTKITSSFCICTYICKSINSIIIIKSSCGNSNNNDTKICFDIGTKNRIQLLNKCCSQQTLRYSLLLFHLILFIAINNDEQNFLHNFPLPNSAPLSEFRKLQMIRCKKRSSTNNTTVNYKICSIYLQKPLFVSIIGLKLTNR